MIINTIKPKTDDNLTAHLPGIGDGTE
jgi:hypothetical protein